MRVTELTAVAPQVFDLLVYLVPNRDCVVSKDDLLAAVWSGRIVAESTLTSRISALRGAVGDSRDTQRLNRAVPRKGLRCVCGDPERCRAAETSACAVPEAVDRGAAVPEHVWPPRARIFRRRHGRGDHHRAQSYSLALRHRPQFELYLQRAGGRRETGSDATSMCDTARRIGTESRATDTDFCAADRGCRWRASLGRPVRRFARRRVRAS